MISYASITESGVHVGTITLSGNTSKRLKSAIENHFDSAFRSLPSITIDDVKHGRTKTIDVVSRGGDVYTLTIIETWIY